MSEPRNDVSPAASVLLARGPGSQEVYLVRRADGLRFFGGFYAFPGGRACPQDADLLPAGTPLAAQRVAAVRELFEETGVLLAHRADGGFPASEELEQARRELLAERISFHALLARWQLSLKAEDLLPAANLVTPAFSPVRFDTAFFVAALPPGQAAEVWPGELSAGAWHSADALLRLWERGDVLVSPPTVSLLEAVRGRAIEELPQRIRSVLETIDAGAIHPIYFSPAVRMIPLHCHGLPPSTHTNAYLVGTGPVYLLDPGPTDPEEQRRLFAVLDEEAAVGRRLTAVVLTHRHPDHVGAAAACSRRYGVPVLGHPLTARALAGKVEVRGELGEGSRLDLGEAPAGGPWHLETMHLPGHAPDHLAFYEPRYRLLFAGDMISTLSSVVIAPPEGDLRVYLASLRRLLELPTRLLLPAHGSPTARPVQTINEALAHRAKREEQLVQALADGPRGVAEIAAGLYQGLPAVMIRFAELQVLAGLHKLRAEGRAEEIGGSDGSLWRRVGN
jgi:glyoxylase-like metal-dependent hydrolase (beta-lactamase superfamily II)/8-oxo-dGTP pyrophosphatase MutT (NUDIX family)